jgi:Ca2+-binding EF-hand superfamily protein
MPQQDPNHMQRKWAHFYNLIDANKDGVLEVEDFELIAERVKLLCDAKGKNVDGDKLKWESKRLFDKLRMEMNLTKKTAIRLWNWFDWLTDITYEGKGSVVYRSFTLTLCREIFEICDQNGDGFVSHAEFSEFFLLFNIPNDVALRSFQILDTNQSGRINKHELLHGIREFFIGTEPNDFDYLFGDFDDEVSITYKSVD